MSNLAVNDAGDVLMYDGQGWKPAPMAANDAGDRVVFDGVSWKPHAELVGSAKGAQPQGRSDALANAVGGGALLNFGDEATAAVRAAAPGLSNFMMSGPSLQRDESIGGSPKPQTVSNAPTFQGRYDEELARARAQTGADAKAYPAMTTAGNIAGGVASTALALPAAATAGAPSLLGNILKMGATGAGLGAAAGAGEGQGQDDRIARALFGAGVGGVTGGALPVAGMVGRAALETAPGRAISEKVFAPAVRTIASALGQPTAAKGLSAAAADGGNFIPSTGLQGVADRASNVAETGAIDRIATALQRANVNPRQIESRLDRMGPAAMLADTDPQFLSMATGAKVMPGATRTLAPAVLESRAKQYPDMMVKAFEGAEPPPSTFQLRGEGQAFDSNLRAVGSRSYGLMDEAGLKQTPALMELYKNDIVDKAINTVMSQERATRVGTSRPPASPVDIMHKVKQEIVDMGVAATGRGASTQSYNRDLAHEFVTTLKAANPELAAADRAYAQAASLPEHFDAGRALLAGESGEKGLTTGSAALGDLLQNADQQQLLAARSGATNAAREKAYQGPDQAVALAKNIDTNLYTQGKLAHLYEPHQVSDIVRVADAIRTFRNTQNKVLGGSQTAEKAVDALDLGGAKIKASPSGITSNVVERIGALITKMTGPNEAVRDAIGRATLNPDSSETRRLLALANEVLRRRAAGSAGQAALAETAASQAGRN